MRFAAALAVTGASLTVITAAVLFRSEDTALAQSTTTVQVGDLYFCDPSFQGGVCETTVNEGESVEWQWVGSIVHTTTECGGDLDGCPQPHLWDSPVQNAGSFSYTFDTPGTYLYRCQVHPVEMRGQVTVLAAAEPSPSPTASPEASPASATPTPAGQPSTVPSAGGAPPAAGGAVIWWVAVVGGGFIVAAGALMLLRARPR